MLSACDSGSGGDNGIPDSERNALENGPVGLLFSYPYNGQKDVTLTTQIALKTQKPFDGDINGALRLVAASGNTADDLTTRVIADDSQPGIYRIQTSRPLRGNVTYKLIATRALRTGDERFAAGETLFRFTTAPTPGFPSAGEFRVTEVAPGETNEATGSKTVFAQFNTIHVSLSETIDPSSVTKNDTFTVTGPNGNTVDGVLLVSGHEISFDPSDLLAPGKYTIKLSDGIRSAFGKSLDGFSTTRTVLDSGKIVEQNLLVDNDQGFDGDADDSILDGLMDNLVTIRTQLIGVNQQPARNQPERRGVLARLSQPGMPGFGDMFPNSIPAGQVLQLKPLSVALNGDVPTPLQSGPIQVQFGTDANVYLMANDYQDIATPTAVRLRFDLNNTTLISAPPGTPEYITQALANGVFNQTALNIQASGLAIPQPNGDLVISTLGTFPLTVNRSDDLTIDFSLTLRLPANKQTPVKGDDVAPFITAQSPSACLYTFGTPAFAPAYNQRGAAPIAFPELGCVQVLQQGGALSTQSGIDSFQIEASPALTFSEPLDPLSVNGNSIQMTGPNGTVDVSYQIDGSSVVLRPDNILEPDTQYTISLGVNSALRDLNGNELVANPAGGPGQTIRFTTEPQVLDEDMTAPVILGELTPGVPCSLEGGDFKQGGDDAGHCAGSMAANDDAGDGNDSMNGGMNGTDNGLGADYPVFDNPKNVSINVTFSKFVQRDSVVLADGCLTGGSGDRNSVNGATVALEKIDSQGNCTSVPQANLAFLNTNDDRTRGFTIRQVHEFNATPGNNRYWVVVCGTENSACSRSIVDTDGLALNTDPLNGTGTTESSPNQVAAGGPDIIMPFDAIDYSEDFYGDQFTVPYTDTNGNGQFDDADGDGAYDPGDERPQAGNQTLVNLTLAGQKIPNGDRSDGKFPAYLSLTRPVAIRETINQCGSRLDAVEDDNGNNVVGDNIAEQCIPVSLLPGGFSALTGIKIGVDDAANVLPGILTGVITGAVQQILDGAGGAITNGTPLQALPGAIGDLFTQALGPLTNGGTGNGTGGAIGGLAGGLTGGLTGALAGGGTGGNDSMDGNMGGGLGQVATTVGNLLQPATGLLNTIVGGLIAGAVGDDGNIANTGQVLLRFPNADGPNGNVAQSGYIIAQCEGSIAGQRYDYEPCFVASLDLVAKAPDGQGVTLGEQRAHINLVGPVSFEQNGRIVIALQNANTFTLNAQALPPLNLPSTATINPGDLHFQLAGNEVHGGRAFPER